MVEHIEVMGFKYAKINANSLKLLFTHSIIIMIADSSPLVPITP